MLTLKIDNPEIESIFINRFHSDQKAFIAFVQKSLQRMTSDTDTELSLTEAQKAELDRRIDAFESDKSIGREASEVIADIKKRL